MKKKVDFVSNCKKFAKNENKVVVVQGRGRGKSKMQGEDIIFQDSPIPTKTNPKSISNDKLPPLLRQSIAQCTNLYTLLQRKGIYTKPHNPHESVKYDVITKKKIDLTKRFYYPVNDLNYPVAIHKKCRQIIAISPCKKSVCQALSIDYNFVHSFYSKGFLKLGYYLVFCRVFNVNIEELFQVELDEDGNVLYNRNPEYHDKSLSVFKQKLLLKNIKPY